MRFLPISVTITVTIILAASASANGQILPPPPSGAQQVIWPDWSTVEPAAEDPLNDGALGGSGGDLYLCKVADNSSFLFMYLEMNPAGNIDPTLLSYSVFMDADRSTVTGYTGMIKDLGVDYIAVYGYPYGGDYYALLVRWDSLIGSFIYVEYLSFTCTNTTLSVAVPMSSMGLDASASLNILFATFTSDATISDNAPDSGFINYLTTSTTSWTTSFTSVVTTLPGTDTLITATEVSDRTSAATTIVSTVFSTIAAKTQLAAVPGFPSLSLILGATFGGLCLVYMRRSRLTQGRTETKHKRHAPKPTAANLER